MYHISLLRNFHSNVIVSPLCMHTSSDGSSKTKLIFCLMVVDTEWDLSHPFFCSIFTELLRLEAPATLVF